MSLNRLRLNGMTGVMVAYDNEEKGDPALPGYNDEVDDRFDAVTWGLLLARAQGRERKAGLMMLPDSLRDKSGKVDWDGALMKLREAGGSQVPAKGSQVSGSKSHGAAARPEVDEPPAVPVAGLDLGDEENPFHRDRS